MSKAKPSKELPAWLPGKIRSYIEDEMGLDRNRTINIVPAFKDLQMKSVWEKLDKLPNGAAKQFAKMIVHFEENFVSSQEALEVKRSQQRSLKSILPQAVNLDKTIRRNLESSVWYKETLLASDALVKQIKDNLAFLATEINSFKPEFSQVGWLTRKRQGNEALARFSAISLSESLTTAGAKPHHEAVATTVNVLFETVIAADDIKKLLRRKR